MFDLEPSLLGMPRKFTSYRREQLEGFDWYLNECTETVVAGCLPTGWGKTLWAVSLAKLLGVKLIYEVATKALESQVMADFESIGMKCIHGQANYECVVHGDCKKGYKSGCSRRMSEACPYAVAVSEARDADLVVTNYAYALYAGLSATAFQRAGMIVCDEAHALEGQLTGYGSVKVYSREISREHNGLRSEKSGVMPSLEWAAWASDTMEAYEDDPDDDDCTHNRAWRVSRMDGNFVWQFDDRGNCTFSPIYLSGYMRRLFGSIPRVLMMSASLTEYVLRLLLPKDFRYDYRAWPVVFPQQNAPVYHIPTVKLSWRSTDEDYEKVIAAMDGIIDRRSDRKGIAQTISYARAKRVLSRSRHNGRLIWNEDGTSLGRSLARFRAADAGTVFASPSVEEGFDFPWDQCEYQIVLKFPFPNETERVIKERCTRIPSYRLNYAAQKLVQIRGRGWRSPDDRCECVAPETRILTDDLYWEEAGSLAVNRRLLCFDETGNGRKDPRRWRFGYVLKAETWRMPRVRVVFEDGEMITTPNHPWLVLGNSRDIKWVRADSLTTKTRLFRLLRPWESPDDWRSGWLAGFADGEGSLVLRAGNRNPNVTGIFIVQNEGLLSRKAISELHESGFQTGLTRNGKCLVIKVQGGFPEILRFLGQVRPARLIDKFVSLGRRERISASSYPRVLAVEKLTAGWITSLQTSTKTYVAEGMGAHNTFILDNAVRQLTGAEGKSLLPSGFRIFTVAQIPAAPPKLEPRVQEDNSTVTTTGDQSDG